MMTKFEKAIKPAKYDFYTIVEDELGNKQLEICGYTYKGDNWKCIDVRGICVPLSEFVEGMKGSEDYVTELLMESKQYEQDMSNEECVWAINHCFDNNPADYVLRFEDVTIDTPVGNYINAA